MADPSATKTFDARVIGTLTTGIVLLADMPAIHEAFEHVLGHPVWTHELADKAVWKAATTNIVAAHPKFPTSKPADWQALAEELVVRYPDGVTLPRGTGFRRADPLTTLREIAGTETRVVVVAP